MKPLVTLALACALFSGALLESPNGKKCFTGACNDFTSIQECTGSQDRCFNFTVSYQGHKVTEKGCASQAMCSQSLYPMALFFDMEMSCCEGNLCNNALRIGQSVLFLLLVPLASVILFN